MYYLKLREKIIIYLTQQADTLDELTDKYSFYTPNLQKVYLAYREIEIDGVAYQVDEETKDIYIKGVRASDEEVDSNLKKKFTKKI